MSKSVTKINFDKVKIVSNLNKYSDAELLSLDKMIVVSSKNDVDFLQKKERIDFLLRNKFLEVVCEATYKENRDIVSTIHTNSTKYFDLRDLFQVGPKYVREFNGDVKFVAYNTIKKVDGATNSSKKSLGTYYTKRKYKSLIGYISAEDNTDLPLESRKVLIEDFVKLFNEEEGTDFNPEEIINDYLEV